MRALAVSPERLHHPSRRRPHRSRKIRQNSHPFSNHLSNRRPRHLPVKSPRSRLLLPQGRPRNLRLVDPCLHLLLSRRPPGRWPPIVADMVERVEISERTLAKAGPRLSVSFDVLSDTMGVDFGPYLSRVVQNVRANWYNIIPEVARPPIMKKGKLSIEFAILKDGKVAGMKLATDRGTSRWIVPHGAGLRPQIRFRHCHRSSAVSTCICGLISSITPIAQT